jgi:hypothetical protein
MFYVAFPKEDAVDWARAVERNTEALIRVVEAIFAMLGLALGGVLEKPPKVVYWAALRLLRSAEAAVRRLIIIAARGLVLKPASVRPMPKGIIRAERTSPGPMAFRLADPRKRFLSRPRKVHAKVGPRVWTLDDPHLIPAFLRPQPAPAPLPEPKPDTRHLSLGRRLSAIRSALDDLPRQAIRFKRWQARRAKMTGPAFTSPLRPGPPPGHRKVPKDDIDDVLKECHWLAFEALKANTS